MPAITLSGGREATFASADGRAAWRAAAGTATRARAEGEFTGRREAVRLPRGVYPTRLLIRRARRQLWAAR